eukprot:scaffold50486_cov76-Phaeocystis_antarctica.AAC.4
MTAASACSRVGTLGRMARTPPSALLVSSGCTAKSNFQDRARAGPFTHCDLARQAAAVASVARPKSRCGRERATVRGAPSVVDQLRGMLYGLQGAVVVRRRWREKPEGEVVLREDRGGCGTATHHQEAVSVALPCSVLGESARVATKGKVGNRPTSRVRGGRCDLSFIANIVHPEHTDERARSGLRGCGDGRWRGGKTHHTKRMAYRWPPTFTPPRSPLSQSRKMVSDCRFMTCVVPQYGTWYVRHARGWHAYPVRTVRGASGQAALRRSYSGGWYA